MIRKSFEISGLVQGVWFRASARNKAIELGLTGFVLNRHNGNVYAEAQGEPAQIMQFEQWCHEGPPLARVSQVLSQNLDVVMEDDSFEILK